jgi:hypothetical protein
MSKVLSFGLKVQSRLTLRISRSFVFLCLLSGKISDALALSQQVLFLTPHDVRNIKEVGKVRIYHLHVLVFLFFFLSATISWASTV